MSGFFAVCVRLSLHRGKGWEREVNFCGRINKREIVSKWFLCCSCLVFSETFVHDCKNREMFSKPGRAKTRTNPSKIEKRAKIRHKAVMLSALQFTCTYSELLIFNMQFL